MAKPTTRTGPKPRLPIQLPIPNIPETMVPETVAPMSSVSYDLKKSESAPSAVEPLSSAEPLSEVEPVSAVDMELSACEPVELEDEDAYADSPWESRMRRLRRHAARWFGGRNAA